MTSEQETAMYDQPSEEGSKLLLNVESTETHGPAGYTVQVGGQTFSQAQWEAAQSYCGGRAGQVPSADEREALSEIIGHVFYNSHQDPTGHTAAAILAAGFHRSVQGEPSDAQVQAALRAYWGGAENAESHGSAYGMRAALRAAAVQGGETR